MHVVQSDHCNALSDERVKAVADYDLTREVFTGTMSATRWSASITSRRYQYVLGCGSAMEADLRRPTGNDPVPSRTPTATSFGFGY